MAQYDTVLVRYGELTTKGKNRKDFIKQLDRNIRRVCSDLEHLSFRSTYDRYYITLNGEDHRIVKERLENVFGISSFSFTQSVPSTIEDITKICVDIVKQSNAKTFKMISRRNDKTFPMISDQINRAVASEILKNTDCKVDVHTPELPIQVEVHKEKTYITLDKYPGLGGYPTGINGKALVMLSGGIDSPVAVYEMMKRGIQVEAIHFASPPYTSENARQKMLDLAKHLSSYQGEMKVHIIPFTDLQLAIYQHAGDANAITLMRRMMYRISERIAKTNRCLVIANGESIGQVASQTLESMACINAVLTMPMIRPLVCMDKLEIIEIARRIGTYETSILPYEDCCTIFDPKNPVTKPHLDKLEHYESQWDYETMIDTCVTECETQIVSQNDQEEDFL